MTGCPGVPRWMPWMSAAASRPDSSGSSLRYSGRRPDSGVRELEMPGASRTLRPARNASSPWAVPLAKASLVLQLAASVIWAGNTVTPAGPRT